MPPERVPSESQALAAAGVLAALAVAAALVPMRASIGPANVALVLALVVTGVAASGGRLPGAVAGVSAAVSFNFFFTRPYLSLRIAAMRDVVTVALLAVMGLAVGEVARRWNDSRTEAEVAGTGLARVVRVANLAAAGAPAPEVLEHVQREIGEELHLLDVVLLPTDPDGARPLLDHAGVVDVQDRHYAPGGFTLPREGVDLAVTYRGRSFGRLVLVPAEPVGITRAQYRCVVALAEQLGAVLATSPAS
ncbi:MAG: PAS domain-containing sensor histidine kinase [Actinobacteria bacterium]|nr:PAS domain-containing sensor histidine kinase [Actinomycetota bacterium]